MDYIDRRHPKSPNYQHPKTLHYCSICEEPILNGEEYVVNNDDKYAHVECVTYWRELMNFLGIEIKIMAD